MSANCPADRRQCSRDTPVRPCKNRIQESHQFVRGQHSPYADPASAPCFHDRPPGQPPATPAGPVTGPAGPGPPRLRIARTTATRPHPLLPGRRPAARPGPLARHPRAAQPGALADPVGAGSQRAPQFTAAGQVTAAPCAEREELVVAGLIVARPGQGGKAVIGVGPHRGLLGVVSRGPDLVGQTGQTVAAALPHRGERGRVPAELQRDLVYLARPVTAGHRGHGQDRSINAT